jgi:hypothetical protein
MKAGISVRFAWTLALTAAPASAFAWDYAGHRIVNQLALASLPPDFPAWVRTPANAERIAFLAGEPDRWRNSREPLLQHANGLDHYFDLEEVAAAGLDVGTLTPFRYVFAAQFAAGRAANPSRFPPVDLEKDTDRSREWPGFLPWAIAEYYAKLQSAFSSLKTFERYGTAADVANARAAVVYLMGVGGHYVGDGAQPLHTTVHFNGWVGPNPIGYTTRHTLHPWIDGGFIAKAGLTAAEIAPRVAPARPLDLTARADDRDPVFVAVVNYLRAQQEKVEPLYRLEKGGAFRVEGGAADPEGRAFISGQLLAGAEMLGALWLTAWRQAAPDIYLRKQLIESSP